jgi:hypothetical protein
MGLSQLLHQFLASNMQCTKMLRSTMVTERVGEFRC